MSDSFLGGSFNLRVDRSIIDSVHDEIKHREMMDALMAISTRRQPFGSIQIVPKDLSTSAEKLERARLVVNEASRRHANQMMEGLRQMFLVGDLHFSSARASGKTVTMTRILEEISSFMPTETVPGQTWKSKKNGRAGLGIREWACMECGVIHDRDINAAKNILALGYGRLAGGIV